MRRISRCIHNRCLQVHLPFKTKRIFTFAMTCSSDGRMICPPGVGGGRGGDKVYFLTTAVILYTICFPIFFFFFFIILKIFKENEVMRGWGIILSLSSLPVRPPLTSSCSAAVRAYSNNNIFFDLMNNIDKLPLLNILIKDVISRSL